MSLTYSTAAVRELYLGFKSDRRPLDRRREYKRLGTVGMTGATQLQRLSLQDRA
jgi:hypothetical protein